jgi:hypothetical protein
MHTVEIDRDRPDFRVLVDLLYGHGRNVDTEGNSYPVNSRTWTELYIKNRESNDPAVDIALREGAPATFEITSGSSRLEELAALYLCIFCGQSLSHEGVYLPPERISQLRTTYAMELARAEASVWHQSSDAYPYPNGL